MRFESKMMPWSMSGSVVLQLLDSVLMPVAHATTKGQRNHVVEI